MSDPDGYPAEFERIEAAVDAGQADLRALGFWRLLARVKADQVLAHHWAEQAGRIDRKAFEARDVGSACRCGSGTRCSWSARSSAPGRWRSP